MWCTLPRLRLRAVVRFWTALSLGVLPIWASACGYIGLDLRQETDSTGSGGLGGATDLGGADQGGGSDQGPGGIDQGGASDGSGGEDGGNCQEGEFGDPVLLSDLAVEGPKWAPSVTLDGLLLLFAVGTAFGEQIYQSARQDHNEPFGPAEAVKELNTHDYQGTPFINAAGTRVYYFVQSSPDQTTRQLWLAERKDRKSKFSVVRELSELNAEGRDHLPWLSTDERLIYFTSTRAQDNYTADIWTAAREKVSEPFSAPKAVGGLFALLALDDGSPSLSPDGLTLYFTSNRTSTYEIWSAERPLDSEEFGAPRLDSTLNSLFNETNARLAPDGRTLYFTSDRSGSNELWVSERLCSP